MAPRNKDRAPCGQGLAKLSHFDATIILKGNKTALVCTSSKCQVCLKAVFQCFNLVCKAYAALNFFFFPVRLYRKSFEGLAVVIHLTKLLIDMDYQKKKITLAFLKIW